MYTWDAGYLGGDAFAGTITRQENTERIPCVVSQMQAYSSYSSNTANVAIYSCASAGPASLAVGAHYLKRS
jgi:hypothetical protein